MNDAVYLFKIFITHDKKLDPETGELRNEVSLKNHFGAGRNKDDWYSRPIRDLESFLELCKEKFGNANYDMGVPPGLKRRENHTIYEDEYKEIGGINIITERRPFSRKEYYDFTERLNCLLLKE